MIRNGNLPDVSYKGSVEMLLLLPALMTQTLDLHSEKSRFLNFVDHLS
jgi:hypothetical protein